MLHKRGENPCIVATVVALAVCLGLVASVAPAAVQTTCSQSIAGPATLEQAVLLGPDGKQSAEFPQLRGDQVVLTSGAAFSKSTAVLPGDEIERGVITNASKGRVMLRFSTGDVVILEAGAAIAVGDATCKCKCTCSDGTASTTALFNCDSNADTCSYNGDSCVFVEGGVVHEGTFSGCKKVWVIRAALEASP